MVVKTLSGLVYSRYLHLVQGHIWVYTTNAMWFFICVQSEQWNQAQPHSSPFDDRTFRDAQRVVTTGNKVVKSNEEVRVTLCSTQQILLRAPAHRFSQCRRVQSKRPVQGLCQEERDIKTTLDE